MRLRELELALAGLPPELDGLRIAHLSDFHLGVPSRGARAVERAVDWVAERRPDLVCDHRRPALAAARRAASCSRCSRGCRASVRRARQPRLRDLARPVLAPGRSSTSSSAARSCSTTSVESSSCAACASSSRASIRGRGSTRSASGFDASAAPTSGSCSATSRARSTASRTGRWDLILAGHLHAGQIVLPYGFGRLLLAHPRAPLRARASTGAARRRCTSRRGSGRPSSRSGSSPARRRPSSFYDPWVDGRPQRHLAGGARALRRRCGGGGAGRAHEAAPRGARRRHRDRSARRRSTTARTSRTSRPRCSSAWSTTWRGWPTSRPSAVNVVVDDVQRRELAPCRRASPA